MILPIIVRPCLFGPASERPVAPSPSWRAGESRPPGRPCPRVLAPRLQPLPRRRLLGREVAVATGARSRLLGLAGLNREEAGAGLLIPRCASVHTVGMRFELDLVFLGGEGRVLAIRAAVAPGRLAWHRGAAAVLELPATEGGESARPGP